MATVALKIVGTAIGTAIGGPLGGKIGGALGAMAGSMLDQSIINSLKPVKQVRGPQVNSLSVSAPRDGEAIARVYGWARCSARPMWPSDLQFVEVETVERTGGKGVVQPRVDTYSYINTITAVFAVCMGPNVKFRRMWVDGTQIDPNDYGGFEWFEGNADQVQLEAVAAVEGIENTPDFAGIAGFVLTDWSTNDFGNRVPQISVEVYRAVAEPRGAISGACLKPGGNEYALEPAIVVAGEKVERRTYGIDTGGEVITSQPELITTETEDDSFDEVRVNAREKALQSDVMASLDVLSLEQPALKTVTICLPWFGSDLRCGSCEIKPGISDAGLNASLLWQVGTVDRAAARVVPVGAGTPSDESVIRLIGELKARGYGITVLPFLEMDIAQGNALPDPYGGAEQAAYPDRGAITCDPARGMPGTVDKTAAAAGQVSAFFGAVTAADYAVVDGAVSYTGAVDDWGYNRFVLHCAALVKAAGGVNSFLIGSGMKGLTSVRSDASTFPAVDRLAALFAQVRVRIGGNTATVPPVVLTVPAPVDGAVLPYRSSSDMAGLVEWRRNTTTGSTYARAADFDEWGSTFPVGDDGYLLEHESAVGINIFADLPIPAGKWHAEIQFQHAKSDWWASGYRSWDAREIFSGSHSGIDITAGKTVEFYPNRALIQWTDEGYAGALRNGADFVRFAYAMAGITHLLRDLKVTLTELIELGYAADWQEYGAFVPADGTGDVLFPLDKIFGNVECDFVGVNYFAPLSDSRQDGSGQGIGEFPGAGPDVAAFMVNIEAGEGFDFSYADYQARLDQVRTPIDDPAYAKAWVFRNKDVRAWWKNSHYARPAGVENAVATLWVPESKPIVFCAFGAAHLDNAANQPDAGLRSYLADQALPYFSTGARDDDAPAFYAQALVEYWQTNEPGMVDLGRSCVWYWDSRPWPDLGETDVYADSAAWSKSHSVSGRPAVTISKLIASEAAYFGLAYSVGNLPGAIYGAQIDNVSGFSEVVNAFTAPFFIDGFEAGGEMRFTSRLVEPVAAELDSMHLVPLSEGKRFHRPRKSADAVPGELWLSYQSPTHDYGNNSVPSLLPDGASGRQESYTIPAVMDEETAAQRIGAVHIDQGVAREGINFKVEKGRYSEFEPGNIINMPDDMGGGQAVVLERVLGVELEVTVQQFDRYALLPLPVTVDLKKVSAPELAYSGSLLLLDLPMIREGQAGHDALAVATSAPWRGWSIYRSTTPETGYSKLADLGARGIVGNTTAAISAGPETIFDRGNALFVKMYFGELVSRTDSELFQGANALALETGFGEWEILQFGQAELVAPHEYKLTRLLRARRDTLQADNLLAGARMVMLDSAVAELGLTSSQAGWSCYIDHGPANLDRSDERYSEIEHYFSRRGLRPFAPAGLAGGLDAAGNLALSCKRRDRALDAVDWSTGPVPMTEAVEAYEWEIAGQVFETALPELGMTAVELGAAGIAAPFTASVFQMSAVVGRGRGASIEIL